MEHEIKLIKIRLIIIALLAAAGLGSYAYLFSLVNLQRSDTILSSEELRFLRAGETAAFSLEKLVADIDAERLALSRYVIRENDAANFIEYVEDRARESGLSVKLSRVAVAGAELEMDIVVDGRFRDIFRALARYEAAPYRMRVTRVRFEKLEKDAWRAAIDLALEAFIPNLQN
ncbi:MAG: hypothetical protein HYS59_00110 [Candidatus Vogelbacteria bacterium]|nr:hypothetical protein [Candidatus Vogelbacteria bacterium]